MTLKPRVTKKDYAKWALTGDENTPDYRIRDWEKELLQRIEMAIAWYHAPTNWKKP